MSSTPILSYSRLCVGRVALLVLGIAIGLAIAEAFVRLTVPAREFWSVAPVYRSVADPDIHFTLEPGLDETAYGVDLTTNSLGFRGPEWGRAKPAGTFRIALIGDSHTFGLGVPFTDTAGEVAARDLRRCTGTEVEVLNFGVNSYNSMQELAVVRQYALQFEPDMVVLQISSNDHEVAPHADAYGYLAGYEPPSGDSSSLRQIAQRMLPRMLRRSRLYLWTRRRLLAVKEQGGEGPPAPDGRPPADPNWMAAIDDAAPSDELEASVGQPVRAMIASSKSHGAAIILVSYASWPDYRRLLKRIAEEEGLPWLDILALFPEAHSYPDLLAQFGLGWDPHLNPIGHERWGRALARVIREGGYLRAATGHVAGCDDDRERELPSGVTLPSRRSPPPARSPRTPGSSSLAIRPDSGRIG